MAEKPAAELREFTDVEFIRFLVNEDSACPVCYRPFVCYDIRDMEMDGKKITDFRTEVPRDLVKKIPKIQEQMKKGFVIPILTRCNHAMCEDCCVKYFEKDVAFVKSGVRCQYHKRDQTGHPPSHCLFVTPCKKPEDMPASGENMLISQVLREITPIALGTKNPAYDGDKEFYYYFKFCHGCQKLSTQICTECSLPFCDDCAKKHSEHKKKLQKVEDYEKTVIQSHKCVICGNQAFKYCAKCKRFLCRNRTRCYDLHMDPDHLLFEFDPSLVELKRFEYTAVDNSRKMFIHDVHDYLETDPFFWQAADMECLSRTMWFQEFHRCHPDAEETDEKLIAYRKEIDEARKKEKAEREAKEEAAIKEREEKERAEAGAAAAAAASKK